MPKVPLIATKGFTYNTRRLVAGDPFHARNPLEAGILTRVRRVAEEPKAIIPTVREVLSAKVVPDDMKALRAAYRKKFGKGPGPSWDAATIREKIDAA